MSTTTDDILRGELRPSTLGECVDALIITNMRMWHAQEELYELDRLYAMEKEELFSVMKYATWLNLERNIHMDGTDAAFVGILQRLHPACLARTQRAVHEETIWERS